MTACPRPCGRPKFRPAGLLGRAAPASGALLRSMCSFVRVCAAPMSETFNSAEWRREPSRSRRTPRPRPQPTPRLLPAAATGHARARLPLRSGLRTHTARLGLESVTFWIERCRPQRRATANLPLRPAGRADTATGRQGPARGGAGGATWRLAAVQVAEAAGGGVGERRRATRGVRSSAGLQSRATGRPRASRSPQHPRPTGAEGPRQPEPRALRLRSTRGQPADPVVKHVRRQTAHAQGANGAIPEVRRRKRCQARGAGCGPPRPADGGEGVPCRCVPRSGLRRGDGVPFGCPASDPQGHPG